MTSELDLLDLSESQKERIALLATSMQCFGMSFEGAIRAIQKALLPLTYTPVKELLEISNRYLSMLQKQKKKERYERRYARRMKN
jgi:hypothetical protein